MIARLRGEASARGLRNVDAVVGDGQALPSPTPSSTPRSRWSG